MGCAGSKNDAKDNKPKEEKKAEDGEAAPEEEAVSTHYSYILANATCVDWVNPNWAKECRTQLCPLRQSTLRNSRPQQG